MARSRHSPSKPSNDWDADHWFPPPLPEAREGGESTWELWHEAARQLDEAFAPTEPSGMAPLSVGTGKQAAPRVPARAGLSADELMVVARRGNRVCPRPEHWMRLYELLGGRRQADLPLPPVQPALWNKLSSLQKRLQFREQLEWAERRGRLPDAARFIDELAEADWLHMDER